ncbi:Fe-S cluster assembly protein HesB [Candidatus Woesearchaeota archaeon]|nr:Fe-S cluster assembly protein HesB [Candidatus Woesearchaeota archaeon]|tara:strand:- start:22 stop:897 length:876 start_codon:yes stop_codon:yes gene_type:complete
MAQTTLTNKAPVYPQGDEESIQAFQKFLLAWYEKNERDLPWRKTRNPYKILVAETMLQQTQIARVIPKYERFLSVFPLLQDLAEAETTLLLKEWQGLGYNRRCLGLRVIAQQIIRDFGGIFPRKYDRLLELKGIGPYTASALCSFAYNQDVACLDTNVRRVLIHTFTLRENCSQGELQRLADLLVPIGRSRVWNNALMDYGSLQLTAKFTGIQSLGKQSKFEFSKRWYRSRIVREVLKVGEISLDELSVVVERSKEYVRSLVSELVLEGFLRLEGELVGIKEDRFVGGKED